MSLFQSKQLPNGLVLLPPHEGSFPLFLAGFLVAGNCANSVLSLGFRQNKRLVRRRNPAKFESDWASEGSEMFSHVPSRYILWTSCGG